MVNRDIAGFVINRINFPSTIEAMKLVEQGLDSALPKKKLNISWCMVRAGARWKILIN
jgi:hypothetical protein